VQSPREVNSFPPCRPARMPTPPSGVGDARVLSAGEGPPPPLRRWALRQPRVPQRLQRRNALHHQAAPARGSARPGLWLPPPPGGPCTLQTRQLPARRRGEEEEEEEREGTGGKGQRWVMCPANELASCEEGGKGGAGGMGLAWEGTDGRQGESVGRGWRCGGVWGTHGSGLRSKPGDRLLAYCCTIFRPHARPRNECRGRYSAMASHPHARVPKEPRGKIARVRMYQTA